MKRTVINRLICLMFVVLFLTGCMFTLVGATTIAAPNANSLEEYQQMTSTMQFPSRYVLYDHIKALGEFKYWIGSYWDYSAHYTFTDINGYEPSLSVELPGIQRPTETNYLSESSDLKDMRSLGTEEKCSIIRGPLEYKYVNGRLLCIVWYLGDVRFSLGGSGYFDDYPMDGEETICSRLLSADEKVALAAYRELIKDIPLQYGETIFSRDKFLLPAIACVAILSIAAFFLIRHKKRKHGS